MRDGSSRVETTFEPRSSRTQVEAGGQWRSEHRYDVLHSVLTCTGDLSRNRTVGFEMGKGRSLEDVLATLGHVAEGVKTTTSAYDLGHKMGVELPIVGEVYRVLYEGKSAQQAVVDLMTRALTKE